MDEKNLLAQQFEAHRRYLQAVAHRILGSSADAEDAVQEAWLRLSRTGAEDVDNLRSWLTTVVARISLDVLRSRRSRPEEPVGDVVPEPERQARPGSDPQDEAVLADSVGLALLVVLETLTPAERLAFVLHDLFAVPFDEIAPIVERTPAAARQLASRARRRVQGTSTPPDPRADRRRQREIVDAWLAASRAGDFAALVRLLDPDVVLRVDELAVPPGAPLSIRGAEAVAGQARAHASRVPFSRPVLIDGTVGLMVTPRDGLPGVLVFVLADDLIVEMEVIVEPARIAALDLVLLDGRESGPGIEDK